jgi:hypothetical protein
MSFNSTPGYSLATSYPSLDEAKEYFKYRLHSSLWADFASKSAALMTATRLLDRWVGWYGNKTTEDQALSWPRDGVVDKDGYYVENDIVPSDIKEATCELAYAMLEDDVTATDDLKGIKSLKVGSLAIEADRFDRGTTIPESVWMAIGVLGKQPSSSQVRVVRC